MSNPNKLVGLSVAGTLAFTACSGNGEANSAQIVPGETVITRGILEDTYVSPETTTPIVEADTLPILSPFDSLSYSALYGDWFPVADSYIEYDLSGEQCAALALARFSLGEVGNSAYSLFEIHRNDGTTSVGGEEVTSPTVLHQMSETIFDTLDGDNYDKIEYYSPQHEDAVIAAISAASVIGVAAKSIDGFNDLEPEESLRINGTDEDPTISMLDQARGATAEALEEGCSYLRPGLINGTLEP